MEEPTREEKLLVTNLMNPEIIFFIILIVLVVHRCCTL